MYDVIIIGGGIIGCSIGRELSKYQLKVLLLEKDADVANGTTKANSAIVHAGYDPHPGTLKAKLNVLGNAMFDQLCQELEVPFSRIGSLVVAFHEEELKTIEEIYKRGLENGVPHMELLSQEQLRALEPNVNKEAVGALYAKTAGIVGPWELAIAMAENAVENGMELRLNTKVTAIDKQQGGYRIKAQGRKSFDTRYVINCGGLYADEIHNMVAEPVFKIIPRKGEYNVLDKGAGNMVGRIIFQCPNNRGKGVLITPTVHGNILVGPNAEETENREKLETTGEGLAYIWGKAKESIPGISRATIITAFAGLRATSDTGDFFIQHLEEVPGFIDVAGIDSPGLTAAPAIAVYVVDWIEKLHGQLEKKEDFQPRRRKHQCFMALSAEDKATLIQKNPAYGRIICRCENITEGEIIDTIHRPVGATTLDGVKRRARPGTGRCQGGFCTPRVMEILAREQGKEMTDIVKDGMGAYILVGPTKIPNLVEDTADAVAASRE